MPRVQTINRQIGAAPLSDAKLTQAQTPESEGAGLADAKAREGEALAGVGAATFNAGQRLGEIQTQHKTEAVNQANEIALLDASNKLDAGVNAMLFDPENGALTLKGKDAMGLPEATASKFGELADNVAGALTNDRQRLAFAKLRAQHEQNLDMTIRRHVFEQTQAYDKNELASFLTNKKDNAVANALDPRRVFEELGAGVDAIRANAKRQGMGPEATQAAIEGLQTDVHVGVISSLLDQKNDRAAKVYFEETKDQIAGGAAGKIEKAIAEGALRGRAQQTADKLLAEGGTDAELADKVKKIDDPELRDAVEARVEHAQAVRDKAQHDQEVDMLNTAYATVDRAHSVDAIAPATWVALGAHQPALRAYANQLAKGEPIETDSVTYYNLLRQAANDPAGFITGNLLESRAKLDNADFKQLADLQLRLKQGADKEDPRLGGARTAFQVVDDSLTRFGVDLKAKDTPTVKAIAELRTLVDKGVANLEQATGKRATADDVQKVTDRILSQPVTVEGSWWGLLPFSGVPFSSASGKLANVRTIADVPLSDRKAIKDAAARAGKPVTDDDIVEIYQQKTAGVYRQR